jgi:DNA-binding transcriptional LysR family regulator
MNLRQLDYFVHVAELGSFSKPARVLDVARPALSRQVRGLKTELRENLSLRNGRGVARWPGVQPRDAVGARNYAAAQGTPWIGELRAQGQAASSWADADPHEGTAARPAYRAKAGACDAPRLENQAALAGIKLDIAWEVSSIPFIIDLVCAGQGHAVFSATGVAASTGASELLVRKLVNPTPLSVLCLVNSSHKRPRRLPGGPSRC